jgi:hypothetical protein
MAGEDKFNYIVKGIRKTGVFRSIGQLQTQDFQPVDDPDQLKAVQIGNAFIEVFGEAATRFSSKQ